MPSFKDITGQKFGKLAEFLAKECRQAQIDKMKLEGIFYSENHGK